MPEFQTHLRIQMEKNNTHLAGEYFVAAELYRRGFSVGMTIGNAKSIDILANKNEISVAIQVKAIRNKKSIGWPIMLDKVEIGIIYIFVNLNDQEQPDFFICTAQEAKDNIKQYSTRGIFDLTTILRFDFKDRWDKIIND